MANYYAGIGARKTPEHVLEIMRYGAMQLAMLGFILRSGGAEGADTAFERGCDDANGSKEIYLPWPYFNDNLSPLHTSTEAATQMASKYHHDWNACSPAVRKLHARNCHQILGANLVEPVRMVICWTPGGKGTGGTGQAIRVARAYNIPVFDLGNPATLDQLNSFMEKYL